MLFQFLTLNPVNFYNLSNLICHLLIGGQFHTVEVIYSPGSLNTRLLSEIQDNCGDGLKWYTIDITQLKPKHKKDFDHFAQLIFPGTDFEFEASNLLQLYPNYYRLFVFPLNIDESFVSKPFQKRALDPITNSVALMYNSTNDSIRAFLMHDDLSFLDRISIQNNNQNGKPTSTDIFKQVFGKRDEMRVIGVRASYLECYSTVRETSPLSLFTRFTASFFFNQMNMSFIRWVCENQVLLLRPTSKQTYKELSWDFEETLVDEQMEQKRNILYLNTQDRLSDGTETAFALNRCVRQKYQLIFIYGDDFPRRNVRRNFFKILAGAWIYIILIISAMAILFFIRHGDMHRRDTLISVYMDITIALTNASSLRYGNRLEKIFFIILLFGTFLINTIALENYLFYTFLTEEEIRMNTLEKYAKFNPPTTLAGLSPAVITDKFGPNANIEPKNPQILSTLNTRTTSIGFVTSNARIDVYQDYFINTLKKEIDIIPESLGETLDCYRLSYKVLVPKNLLNKFNQAITSYMENGLEAFYKSYAEFLSNVKLQVEKYKTGRDDNEAGPKPLRLDQLYFFLTIYGIQILIAIGAFITEIIVHRNRTRRVDCDDDV